MTYEEARELKKRREHLRAESQKQMSHIVELAGFEILARWELVNLYWPDAPDFDYDRQPWWLFQTEIGLVQLGWRKNVIHIEWTTCKVRGIVTEDTVTKCDIYVHAWSVEKAVEYMKGLRKLATSNWKP